MPVGDFVYIQDGVTYYRQMFGPPNCESLRGYWNSELGKFILNPPVTTCDHCWIFEDFVSTYWTRNLWDRWEGHHPDEHLYLGKYYYVEVVPTLENCGWDYDVYVRRQLEWGLNYALRAGFNPMDASPFPNTQSYWDKPTDWSAFWMSDDLKPYDWMGDFVPVAPTGARFDTKSNVRVLSPLTMYTRWNEKTGYNTWRSYSFDYFTKNVLFLATEITSMWKWYTIQKIWASDPLMPNIGVNELVSEEDSLVTWDSGYTESGSSADVSYLRAHTYHTRRPKLQEEF